MQADLDAKRAAGEVESTDMHVWDFQVTMNCVRHKAPAQGTMQEMVQLLLSPNLTPRRLEEKAQLALSSFFGWPAATRLVQALEVDSPCTESRYGLPTDGGAGEPSRSAAAQPEAAASGKLPDPPNTEPRCGLPTDGGAKGRVGQPRLSLSRQDRSRGRRS